MIPAATQVQSWLNKGLALLYPEVCQLCKEEPATPRDGFVGRKCWGYKFQDVILSEAKEPRILSRSTPLRALYDARRLRLSPVQHWDSLRSLWSLRMTPCDSLCELTARRQPVLESLAQQKQSAPQQFAKAVQKKQYNGDYFPRLLRGIVLYAPCQLRWSTMVGGS